MDKFRPLRVGMLTTLNTNIGDDFIREGLAHIVKSVAPDRALQFVPVSKHSPHTVYPQWHPIYLSYKGTFEKRLESDLWRRRLEKYLPPYGGSLFDSCDVILQCGTPVIWEDCRKSEWADLIWRNILNRLGKAGRPILNLGGGACYPWERQPTTLIGNPDQEFITMMLQSACVTTARDRLTHALFSSLGFFNEQICCPALLTGQTFTQALPPTRKVLINYMHGGGHYDFGQGIDAGAWKRTVDSVLERLIARGWEPCYLAHNQRELDLAIELWPHLPRVLPRNSAEYFAASRDAFFGIFNRMHASVALGGLGIPSVAIGTDARNLMVEGIGLTALYVKDATAERLNEEVDRLIDLRQSESERLLKLRALTEQKYQAILKPFLVG